MVTNVEHVDDFKSTVNVKSVYRHLSSSKEITDEPLYMNFNMDMDHKHTYVFCMKQSAINTTHMVHVEHVTSQSIILISFHLFCSYRKCSI